MPSFGFNCDEKTYRLIQSIPPGKRSQVIRDAINAYVPEIECMVKEYWKIRREEAKRELERKKRRKKERERFEQYRRRLHKKREKIAKSEAEHWLKLYSSGTPSSDC